MAIEIVDLTIEHAGSIHSFLSTFTKQKYGTSPIFMENRHFSYQKNNVNMQKKHGTSPLLMVYKPTFTSLGILAGQLHFAAVAIAHVTTGLTAMMLFFFGQRSSQ